MIARRLLSGLILAAVSSAASLPATQAQAQGCDTSMQFVNNSSRTVMELYYNPTRNSDWGPDRLGANVLRPGQTTSARLQFAVPYDFRMVWEGGQSAELRNVNVCQIGQIIATNQGLRAQ